jgi:hypothetical protein
MANIQNETPGNSGESFSLHTCSVCHITKSSPEFWKARKAERKGICKPCLRRIDNRKWLETHRDEQNSYSRRRYRRNRETINLYRRRRFKVRAAAEKAQRDKDPRQAILCRARRRAARKGLECTLTKEQIVIRSRCPYLGIPLRIPKYGEGHPDDSPTLDRIDNSLGYIARNVVIVSARANRIKNVAQAPEILEKMADFLVRCEKNPSLATQGEPARLNEARVKLHLQRPNTQAKKEGNLPLTRSDLFYPRRCPILGVALKHHAGDPRSNSFSIVRINLRKGHVQGNLAVMSHAAASIRSNAKASEHRLIAAGWRNLPFMRVGDFKVGVDAP